MKIFGIVLSIFLMQCSCVPLSAHSDTTSVVHPLRVGLELDPLPFIFQGYIVAAWVGREHFKLRALTVRVRKPDFLLPSGFTDNIIYSNAVLVDYFLDDNDFQGIWLSAGAVSWRGSISHIDDQKTRSSSNYQCYLLSLDAGYCLNLVGNLYISPWAAMHIRVAGDANVRVGSNNYTPPLFNPEASLKFGYFF